MTELHRVEGSALGRVAFELTYALSFAAMTLGFSLRTTGRQNIPKKGPALIIANHESFLDPMVVGLATRRPLFYLARKTLFRNRWFGGLLRLLQAVPLDQEGFAKQGIRAILDVLAEGEAVLMFPEGSRTFTGAMSELKRGIELLLKRSTAPVIPVGIAGAFAAWPRTRKCPVPSPLFLPPTSRTIAVSIGRQMSPGPLLEMDRDVLLRYLAGKLAYERSVADQLRRK